LVLVDLGGTLFFRTSKKHETGGKKDLKVKQSHVFRKPGHVKFLRSLYAHPRIKLMYYSSMMAKNITPMLSAILVDDLVDLSSDVRFFDQEYCPLMS